jgi:hypothetical protein
MRGVFIVTSKCHPAAFAVVCAMGVALATSAHAFDIPQPLKSEHHELHARLQAATQAGGKTGEAARSAFQALSGHFEKEERYALPQLGALPALVGTPGAKSMTLTSDQNKDLLARTERFRAELPGMLKEHEVISAALHRLQEAARAEGNEQVAHVAEAIITHAKIEELVLYPAALLIDDFVAAMEGKR